MRRDTKCAWTRALAACLTALLLAVQATPAAELSAAGAGLAAVFGPAAAGLGDAPQGGFGNPALLAGTDRALAVIEGALADGELPGQRLGGIWPGLGAGTIGVGMTHRSSLHEGAARSRTDWHVSQAHRTGPGLALAATLRLRDDLLPSGHETSFGVDVGAHLRHGRGGLEAGAWLRNLVPPEAADGRSRDGQAVEAGAAYTQPLGEHWRCTALAGLGLAAGAPGEMWLGARMTYREHLAVAVGGTRGTTSGSVGLHRGRLHLEYARLGGDAPRHLLTFSTSLGPTRASRRAAAAARDATRLTARVDAELQARRGRAIAGWLSRADSALAAGDHAGAAEGYRNALLWNPDEVAARDGLQHAQRGIMLGRADSLLAARDSRGAALALEQAAQLFPADSVVVARWRAARHAVDLADRTRSEAAQQVRLGFDAYADQRFVAAARAFEAALQLDPADAMAAEFLQRARTARAQQVQDALAQARSRLRQQDPAGARDLLQTLAQDGPPPAEAERLLAQAERALERQAQERRLADARRAEEVVREDRAAPPPAAVPQLTTAFEAGMQKYRAGDLPAAMLAWEQVARHAPHFGEVDRYLLRVYRVVGLESYTEGRLQDAIDIWGKALKLEPENPQVRRYLEQANAKLQRVQGSREPR